MKRAFRRGLLPLFLAAAMTFAASAWFYISRDVSLEASRTAVLDLSGEAVSVTGDRFSLESSVSALPAGDYTVTIRNRSDIPAAYSLVLDGVEYSEDLRADREVSFSLTCYHETELSLTPLWSASHGSLSADGHIIVGEAPSPAENSGSEPSGT